MTIINRSKERIKSTGEVFTPLPLVDEILAKLPQDTWAPDRTYLDPACGDGNFLVRVVAHKIFHGSTPEQALKTTYGVDLMLDNVSHARQRVLTNAFSADFMITREKILLKHLDSEDEHIIGLKKSHDEFCRKYNDIVMNNIICHDALTYCYRFNDVNNQPRDGSIGKCACDICVPKSNQFNDFIDQME